jgi:hypothetical protein
MPEVRNSLRRRGYKNSFKGGSIKVLKELLLRVMNGEVPEHFLLLGSLREHRKRRYDDLIEQSSLDHLAKWLPDEAWAHYVEHGWLKLSLGLSAKEKRFIALCHRVALAELGVVSTDPSTYANAHHVIGYDHTWGWLRAPACSQAQLFLATREPCPLSRCDRVDAEPCGLHSILNCARTRMCCSDPKLYRLYVGLYARLILQQGPPAFGITSHADAIRCCVELRLQIYNTKIRLPSTKTQSFSHLDCDWKRKGCQTTPAPQCLTATSPAIVASKRVYSIRFGELHPARSVPCPFLPLADTLGDLTSSFLLWQST